MCSEPRLCDTMLDTSRCCSSSLLHLLAHSFVSASRVICRDQADKTDRHYHLSFVKYWLRRETETKISRHASWWSSLETGVTSILIFYFTGCWLLSQSYQAVIFSSVCSLFVCFYVWLLQPCTEKLLCECYRAYVLLYSIFKNV